MHGTSSGLCSVQVRSGVKCHSESLRGSDRLGGAKDGIHPPRPGSKRRTRRWPLDARTRRKVQQRPSRRSLHGQVQTTGKGDTEKTDCTVSRNILNLFRDNRFTQRLSKKPDTNRKLKMFNKNFLSPRPKIHQVKRLEKEIPKTKITESIRQKGVIVQFYT